MPIQTGDFSMTDLNSKKFSNLDDRTARAFLREGSIDRQSQSLSAEQTDDIRMGRQDQSLTGEDAVHALVNADRIWPQVQTQMGSQQA